MANLPQSNGERFVIMGYTPSWKNHRQIQTNPATGKRRMAKSDICERWFGEAAIQLRGQVSRKRWQTVVGECGIDIELYYQGKRRPDLDNGIGGILDAAQLARVIGNDSQVTQIRARVFEQTGDDSRAVFEVWPIGNVGR